MFKIIILQIGQNIRVRPISQQKWTEGYGLNWDSCINRLVFANFWDSRIVAYDVETKRITTALVPGISHPAFVVPIKDRCHHYLVSSDNIAVLIKWNGENSKVQVIDEIFRHEEEPQYFKNGLHVAVPSKDGQFILGSSYRGAICSNSTSPNGGFFIYSEKTGVVKPNFLTMKEGAGIALNAAGDIAFIIDVCNRVIYQFDFDSRTGSICKCFWYSKTQFTL